MPKKITGEETELNKINRKATKKATVNVNKEAGVAVNATAAKKATTAKKTAATAETTVTKKTTATKKATTTKKATAAKKTAAATKVTATKKNTTAAKATASKKTSTAKKTTTKKVVGTEATNVKKAASMKKTTSVKKTKGSSSKKNSSLKKIAVSSSKVSKTKVVGKPRLDVIEYYDLPYRYNQTIVKILYQTPTTLFIYWDISDSDREKYVKQYGSDFFNNTVPVLIVHNDSMHYSFELEINDFANSWYLHVNDSNCKYRVELGRRPRYVNNEKKIDIPYDYLYVSRSNEIESPNDHVLFNKNLDTVYFRDVKTNIITAESVTSLSFIRNMGKIYSLYDLQTNFNSNSWMDENRWQLDMQNPSSSNPTSTFK